MNTNFRRKLRYHMWSAALMVAGPAIVGLADIPWPKCLWVALGSLAASLGAYFAAGKAYLSKASDHMDDVDTPEQ